MRVWIMAMDNDGWIIENKSRRYFGRTVEELEVALANLNKNEYILFNGDLYLLVRFFNEGGLMLREDFKFSSTQSKKIMNIHYCGQNKNICFRSIIDFFGIKYQGKIEDALKRMWAQIDEFVKLSEMRTFYHYRSLEDIIRSDWREAVDWEHNFKNKLTKEEFFELRSFVRGGVRTINKKFLNKLVKTKSYDVNSCYQAVWETYPIPVGKPIYDWKSKDCHHNLQLIVYRLRAKVKDGYLPILARKQISFDWWAPESTIEQVFDEVCYSSGDEFDLVCDFYDIENIEIIKVYCFEEYKGDGFKKHNDKWEYVKQNTSSPIVRAMIKQFSHKIVGASASEKLLKTNRTFVEDIDGNSNFSTIEKNIGVKNVPYIPLYLFITDFARDRMYLIGQQFSEYLVASNIDSLTFTEDLPSEELEKMIEIDDKKIGAFKKETDRIWSYFKSPVHYLKAISPDRAGDIIVYKWSGKKDMSLYNLSLNDAIKRIEEEAQARENKR